ncbi:hypothetical protein ACEWY4_005426 [Coilia grayii]|uniref:Transforming acidic coiled-coil-containing protein C-terminal domain-containing protein n=1 Tax=Coilia grayii TaxID=363190 RepID=A0ABD1KIY4_9TELE
MSSSHENDENLGVHTAGKPGESEAACDIFTLEQPTGRPSILRQSQFENVTNKTVSKGVKVCFQTPRRDPVTKRILSPSKNRKMNGLDECISTLESLKLTSPDESVSQKDAENAPVLQSSDSGGQGDVPIQSKGSYQLDLDNLDTISPFQSSNKMAFSPAQPCVGATVCRSTDSGLGDAVEVTLMASDKVLEEAVKSDLALDETLPMIASLENSVDHGFAGVSSIDSPVIIDPLKLLVSQTEQSLDNDTEELPKAISPVVPEPAQNPESKSEPPPVSKPLEETPLPSRGTYSFDFDNLDSVNPFQTGGCKIPNSPALERKVESVKSSPPKQEHAHDEQKNVEKDPVIAQPLCPVVSEPAQNPESKSEPPPVSKPLEETPLPPLGTYSFDFDNLDSVNPFQTGGSKIPNSPVLERKVESVKSSPPKQEHSHDEQKNVKKDPVIAQPVTEAPAVTEDKPVVVEETSASKETSGSQPAPAADGQVKLLEFNFGDDAQVKRKPPFKKLGKKPPGAKASEKTAPTEKKPATSAVVPKPAPKKDPQDDAPTEAALPKGCYSVDFDKWDDPNFNPFGTKVNMGNSSAAVRQSAVPERTVPADAPAHLPSPKPVAKVHAVQKHTEEHTSPENADLKMEDVKNTITALQPEASQPHAPVNCPPTNPAKHDQMAPVYPEPTELDQPQQNLDLTAMAQDEEFVPGNTFMAGFDGQFDYLEQFGSSTFKESALRKQSLYLNFDPLLRESPKKGAGVNCVGLDLPRPSLAARMDAQKPAHTKLSQGDSVKLLDDLPAPDPTMLDLLAPTFKQPVKNEDAIIEVLKYSQKDMDALVKAKEEAERQANEMKAERDALLEEKRQLGGALVEFESTYAQILAEKDKEKQALEADLKTVQQEKDQALVDKDQALMDLNSMEKSFFDLFKRLDKHKEVIDGFKKNEETLKACVQDYIARIKKEEQRYKSLKAHAEEKISLANAEMAELKAKHRAEATGLQAQLKKEQIRVQSLQTNLDQKIKDLEELNKVCEDLILNVQKN